MNTDAPVDLAAVQADDALLDMLGGTVVITDDELSRVLYAWRREVDAEPIGELVDTDTAVARKPASRRAPQWVWLLLTFLTSAVVCAAIEVISR